MAQAHLLADPPLPANSRKPHHFDLTGWEAKQDPSPTFAAMRAAGAVVRMRFPFVGEVWACTTHAACEAMVKDNATFVQEGRHAGKSGVAGMQWWMPATLKLLADNMLLKDEPEHRRLRKLVDHAFARRDILAMRSTIDALADRLIDDFEGGTVDLSAALARRLPTEVICDLLGIPPTDRPRFADLARQAFQMRSVFDLVRAMGLLRKMAGYLREEIENARRYPRPGLIGELVAAEADGERLSEDELLAMVFLLLAAGLETTTHLIADSVLALDGNPEQKAWLLADPAARMERAVEELARLCGPVQMTKPRYVARDVDFFGASLRRGDIIMAILASANLDPAVFDAPDELRLDRFPNPHLVFSSGVHFCLGMQLARVETQSALSRLYARYPDLAVVDPEHPDWLERPGLRGLRSLPVRLGRRVA